MKKKYIYIIALVLIVAVIAIKLASNKSKINEKKESQNVEMVAIPVKVDEVKEREGEVSLIKTGSLAPFKEGNVLATVAGTVQSVRFQLGDQVKKGQILAIMDTRLLKLDLSKAEQNVRNLARDVKTYTDLANAQAATQEKVNELTQNYQDALNQVDQLKKQISDAQVKSPINGMISEKTIEEGVYANVGFQMARVVNLSELKVQVYLTEQEVYQVKLGQQIELSTDVYRDQKFTGKITFTSPQADEGHNYMVEVLASNHTRYPLRSGTFVYADFSRKTMQTVLEIPREALIASTKDAAVYVVEGAKAKLRKIEVAGERGAAVQVSSGLQKGEKVITSGQINLKDGSTISISK